MTTTARHAATQPAIGTPCQSPAPYIWRPGMPAVPPGTVYDPAVLARVARVIIAQAREQQEPPAAAAKRAA